MSTWTASKVNSQGHGPTQDSRTPSPQCPVMSDIRAMWFCSKCFGFLRLSHGLPRTLLAGYLLYMRDFWLQPRCKRNLLSSGMLHSLDWQCRDSLSVPSSRAEQVLEDGTDMWPETQVTNQPSTLRDIPGLTRRPQTGVHQTRLLYLGEELLPLETKACGHVVTLQETAGEMRAENPLFINTSSIKLCSPLLIAFSCQMTLPVF